MRGLCPQGPGDCRWFLTGYRLRPLLAKGGLLPALGDQALGSSAPKDLGEQRVWPFVPWWVTPGASTSPVGGHVCSRFRVGSDGPNSSVHPGLRELKGATVRIPTWLRATSL